MFLFYFLLFIAIINLTFFLFEFLIKEPGCGINPKERTFWLRKLTISIIIFIIVSILSTIFIVFNNLSLIYILKYFIACIVAMIIAFFLICLIFFK